MIDARRRMLLCEIELESSFAMKAYGGATSALGRRDPEGFWYSVQALLGAAANLHRFLQDDQDLRTFLEVPADSPLLGQRLEGAADLKHSCVEWLASHPRGPLRQSNFGPFGVSHSDPSVFARFIDPEESLVRVFGESYDLARLLSAIAGLSQKVKNELRQIREMV